MKKFKANYQVYILFLITMLIIGHLFKYELHSNIDLIFYMALVIFEIYALINAMFSYTGVDDKGVIRKTLTSRKFISWDEVDTFSFNVNKGVLLKYSVAVEGDYKQINISNWTKNSKELIKIIIDECKKRDKKVEILVEKIIED
ncbi:MAG: hypothetical protein PHX70_06500 [Clostridium sp.]|nr:hypothetical protein [Clostridium sp.]